MMKDEIMLERTNINISSKYKREGLSGFGDYYSMRINECGDVITMHMVDIYYALIHFENEYSRVQQKASFYLTKKELGKIINGLTFIFENLPEEE